MCSETQREQLCPQLSQRRDHPNSARSSLVTHSWLPSGQRNLCSESMELSPCPLILSPHVQLTMHATEAEWSGTRLGAALEITEVTVIKMLSDKRLTVQLGSLRAGGQQGWKQLLGRGQGADDHSSLREPRLEKLPEGYIGKGLLRGRRMGGWRALLLQVLPSVTYN